MAVEGVGPTINFLIRFDPSLLYPDIKFDPDVLLPSNLLIEAKVYVKAMVGYKKHT